MTRPTDEFNAVVTAMEQHHKEEEETRRRQAKEREQAKGTPTWQPMGNDKWAVLNTQGRKITEIEPFGQHPSLTPRGFAHDKPPSYRLTKHHYQDGKLINTDVATMSRAHAFREGRMHATQHFKREYEMPDIQQVPEKDWPSYLASRRHDQRRTRAFSDLTDRHRVEYDATRRTHDEAMTAKRKELRQVHRPAQVRNEIKALRDELATHTRFHQVMGLTAERVGELRAKKAELRNIKQRWDEVMRPMKQAKAKALSRLEAKHTAERVTMQAHLIESRPKTYISAMSTDQAKTMHALRRDRDATHRLMEAWERASKPERDGKTRVLERSIEVER